MNTDHMQILREIVDAMKVLDQAKADAKAVIDAACDAYGETGGKLTKKGLKEVAKAVLKLETKEAASFHQDIADALDSIGK